MLHYITSNYHLYFIVDVDEKKRIAIVYYMPEEKREVNTKLSYEEFDSNWNRYTEDDRGELEQMFIPEQLLSMKFTFTKSFISRTSIMENGEPSGPALWCTRILLKQKKGNQYIMISKCCASFTMIKYERIQGFISHLGMHDSVFPYVMTNKQIYCVDYIPYTIDKKYISDPYDPKLPTRPVQHKILIEPPDVTQVWWW
jgi:hypothetical protein